MHNTDKVRSRFALTTAHVAGMIDLVALPVWVASLMQGWNLDPQQAGTLVTCYLIGAVASCAVFAPRSHRLPGYRIAPFAFALAALLFFALSFHHSFGIAAALHAVAGAATGCGLSFAHGAMGRAANPHRTFATAHVALAIFGILFFAGMPHLTLAVGPHVLFLVFTGVSACAALAATVGFPRPEPASKDALEMDAPGAGARTIKAAPFPRAAWFIIGGIVCMGITQAMIFSFVTQIGLFRGFSQASVDGVLIAVGLVNLLPAVLAALLQHRVDEKKVVLAGPVGQAILALIITGAATFPPYAVAAGLYVFLMIFVHTFVFSLLARIEPTGRAVALTPAMLMIGSAVGPVMGGTLAVNFGYTSLGIAATVVSLVAVASFSRVRLVPAPALPEVRHAV
jgi:predicted MFS family arabinose efflux permease